MNWEKEIVAEEDMEENQDVPENSLMTFHIPEDMKDIRIDKCLLLLTDSFSRSGADMYMWAHVLSRPTTK